MNYVRKILGISNGIPKSLLDKITVTENEVFEGKTFMDSEGSLKEGTHIPYINTGTYTEEVIEFGMKVGFNSSNNNAMQNVVKWKSGYSNNLPYGTYRVYAQAGHTDGGAIQVFASIGGVSGTQSTDRWGHALATITASGNLNIYSHIPSRPCYGFLIVVTKIIES